MRSSHQHQKSTVHQLVYIWLLYVRRNSTTSVAFAANHRTPAFTSQLFVTQLPPLHNPSPYKHAKSRSPASSTTLGPCATRTVLQSQTENFCDSLWHITVRQSNAPICSHGTLLTLNTDPTMSLSSAVAMQAARRPQQQLDPAHEQPS